MANNSDLQELRDLAINASVVVASIMKNRKFSIDEKIDRSIERFSEEIVALIKLRRARNDSQE